MIKFPPISAKDPIKEVIKRAFDTELPLSGGWGYSHEEATIIEASDISLLQTEHVIASMRAYLEMNLTQESENRYGNINLKELSRERVEIDGKNYDKVDYEVSAMLEATYNQFIQEYKEGYGKEGFNMSLHFQRRKEETLCQEVTYWFLPPNDL
jgi:hypothetical protein